MGANSQSVLERGTDEYALGCLAGREAGAAIEGGPAEVRLPYP